MKKIFTFVLFITLCFTSGFAKDLISDIPEWVKQVNNVPNKEFARTLNLDTDSYVLFVNETRKEADKVDTKCFNRKNNYRYWVY